jgi:hypothetical protein
VAAVAGTKSDVPQTIRARSANRFTRLRSLSHQVISGKFNSSVHPATVQSTPRCSEYVADPLDAIEIGYQTSKREHLRANAMTVMNTSSAARRSKCRQST